MKCGFTSGGLNHSYDISLYADDWPAMFDVHSREIVKKAVGFNFDEELV